jgi:hypothetical protein
MAHCLYSTAVEYTTIGGECQIIIGSVVSAQGRSDPLLCLLDDGLNLLDEYGQVGLRKTHLCRRYTIVLDIGGNMLVMRIRALQGGLIRMWLGIVPTQFPVTLPDFVTIPVYHDWQTVIQNPLTDHPRTL